MKKMITSLIFIFFMFSCSEINFHNNNERKIIENSIENRINLVFEKNWISFYQTKNKDFSIIEVDLTKVWISFWWIDIDKSKDFSKFKRYYAKDFYNKIWKEKILFLINWQFFNQNKNPTTLSFPLKSDWKILNDYIDNDFTKRTFIIDNFWNAKILDWYKKEFLNNTDYKELIVAFSPEVKARKNAKIWRTYIWLLSSKKVVFFIAKNKNQEEINRIIWYYWIKENNIIMMDWWPSSQFAYFKKQFYWAWEVPQVFVIYEK